MKKTSVAYCRPGLNVIILQNSGLICQSPVEVIVDINDPEYGEGDPSLG